MNVRVLDMDLQIPEALFTFSVVQTGQYLLIYLQVLCVLCHFHSAIEYIQRIFNHIFQSKIFTSPLYLLFIADTLYLSIYLKTACRYLLEHVIVAGFLCVELCGVGIC